MFSLSHIFSLFRAKPDAAKAWKAAGGEAIHAYWLFSAPVHLLLGRDNYFMHTSAPITLAEAETTHLLADLNAHFAQDGLQFYVRNGTWFLGLNESPHISTTPLTTVIERDISAYLPTGAGALHWAKRQNEIQMLLFTHPVNVVREQRGELTVNSLWCYGEAR